MGQLLDWVPFGSDFQKLHDVLMVNGQVWRKTTATNRPLADHIYHGLEQLHNMYGTGGLTVVFNGCSPMPYFSKITRSSSSKFGHHPYLRLGIQDVPHVIIDMGTKATDGQPAFFSKIGPYWRGQREKAFGHIAVKLIGVSRDSQDLLCPIPDFSDSFLWGHPFGQISGCQKFSAVFVQPFKAFAFFVL